MFWYQLDQEINRIFKVFTFQVACHYLVTTYNQALFRNLILSHRCIPIICTMRYSLTVKSQSMLVQFGNWFSASVQKELCDSKNWLGLCSMSFRHFLSLLLIWLSFAHADNSFSSHSKLPKTRCLLHVSCNEEMHKT